MGMYWQQVWQTSQMRRYADRYSTRRVRSRRAVKHEMCRALFPLLQNKFEKHGLGALGYRQREPTVYHVAGQRREASTRDATRK